jgi:amino acid adenylation domain-containing protein
MTMSRDAHPGRQPAHDRDHATASAWLALHRHYEHHASRSPHSLAAVCGAQSLTYAALNAQANRLARALRGHGVVADGLVGLCVQRSLGLPLAVLSVLKAGAAYVPLDPAYPGERLAWMLADARPPVLLSDSASRPALDHALHLARQQAPDYAPTVLSIHTDAAQWSHLSDADLDDAETGLTPEHLAYVIYTSGSTGRPKGVQIPHRGVSNLIHAQRALLSLDADCRVLQFASLSFDACAFEWIMAYANGACLVLAEAGEVLAGETLSALIERHGVTHATLPPVALSSLPQDAPLSSVRVLLSAGEALAPALMRRFAAGRTMFNAYGPTEATIWSTAHRCDATSEATTVPIGAPLPGVTVHVLDDQLKPVAAGEIGEICIGGAGVTRGYLNRPELTAEKFVTSPHVPGERLYRSGDLGRKQADGTLVYAGRNDFQVKLRGYRIELGEIQAQLDAQPGVQDAVVLARTQQDDGQQQLVAYYRRKGEETVSPEALRAALLQVLPEYMVPVAYVAMETWPQTPNGKLDRDALPAPAAGDYASETYAAPEGEIEQALAKLWCEVLGREQVGRLDAFLQLGGHSLKLIQLAPRIRRELRREVGTHELFKTPRLWQMAALIASRPALEAEEEDTSFDAWSAPQTEARCPVSYQQHGLWLLEQVSRTSLAYNAQNVIRIKGEIDVEVLQRALDAVVERHEAFRTTFHADEHGEPYQVVHAAAPGILRTVELAEGAPEEELQRLIDAHVHHRFDLAQLPLVHMTLIRVRPGESVLIHVEQHYIHDGWSANLLMREMLALYAAEVEKREIQLPAVQAQYRDYARWQHSAAGQKRFAEQAAWWKRTLAGAPLLLPMQTDFPRPAVPSFRGGQIRFELEPALARRLRAFCRERGVTLYAAMHAVYQIVLHRQTGSDDLVIGAAVANRKSQKAEGMLGMFVNTIAVRCDLGGTPTFEGLLERTMRTLADAYDHEEVPFGLVVREVRPERAVGRNPLFQTAFSAHDSDIPSLTWPGFTMSMFEAYSNRTSKFDFDVVMIPRGTTPDGITLFWDYSLDLYRHDTIAGLSERYLRVLAQCLETPQLRIDQVELLAPDARARLSAMHARTAAPMPALEAFAAQVAARPEALAAEGDGLSLTYAELDARSTRLARALRAQGVGAERIVGLCLRRTPLAAVAVLAVMKSGGAYLPLDADYPAQRLAMMLADARPALLLVDADGEAALHAARAQASGLDHDAPLLRIDHDASAQAAADITVDAAIDTAALAPERLAYVIYTSGSTGTPKGAMIEHRQLAAVVAAWGAHYPLRVGMRHLQLAGLAFDVFTGDLLRALCFGGTVVFCPREIASEPAALLRTLREARIDAVDMVPAVFNGVIALLEAEGTQLHAPEMVICGSDAWSGEAARRARARCAPGVRLFNAYGLTETAIDSTALELRADDDAQALDALLASATLPIGRPLPNVRVLLLDAHGALVPEGAVGELCIGGDAVGRGYLNRPELTASRFIDSPYHPDERLYRTGDLARWRADGHLEFLGRNDHQVKIRGFRIELGEIETALRALPGVEDALVLACDEAAREDDAGATRSGRKFLAAYVLGADAPQADALRRQLAERLPAHMLPAAYLRLAAWPLTAHGKLDRRALPLPDASAFAAAEYVAPDTPLETAMAELWAEVLGVPRVGMQDDFFALGGDSLSAVRLLSAVREQFGVGFPLAALFAAPRVGPVLERVLEALSAEFAEAADASIEAPSQAAAAAV